MRAFLFMLMLLITSSLSNLAEAKPFYRFWRGWKKESLERETFQAVINQIFIPATVAAGSGLGLLAYIPALKPSSLPAHLPEELALVVYESKEKYDLFKNTPEGQAYSNLHWDYFSKELGSTSKVPETFNGELQVDHAYDLLDSEADWQRGFVEINYSKVEFAPTPYVQKVRDTFKTQGLQSYLVLMADGYFIEYSLWDQATSYQKAFGALDQMRAQADLASNKMTAGRELPYAAKLGWGQAMSASFNSHMVFERNIIPEDLFKSVGCNLDIIEHENSYLEQLDFGRQKIVLECSGSVLYHGGEAIESSYTSYLHLLPTFVGNNYYLIGEEQVDF